MTHLAWAIVTTLLLCALIATGQELSRVSDYNAKLHAAAKDVSGTLKEIVGSDEGLAALLARNYKGCYYLKTRTKSGGELVRSRQGCDWQPDHCFQCIDDWQKAKRNLGATGE